MVNKYYNNSTYLVPTYSHQGTKISNNRHIIHEYGIIIQV